MKPTTFPIDDAGELLVDVETLVDTRMLVQANSGGGKSHAVRRILEQTHGLVQQLVIDPEGEFASLRERHDYVLAAPSGGDTVAHPRSAALLAERLLELGVSAILDLYELPAKPPINERVVFVERFLDALIDAPKRLWHPVLVVVDEAHVFCPEEGKASSAGSVINLCSRGRKRGFCAILATQRIASLHKGAAADLNNKLIGRATLDVDVKRAGDEIGFEKKDRAQLKELPPGRFFAMGPALNKRGVVAVQVGAVRTTHPKAGARIALAPPPATSKIRALLPKLADLPAEAEDRARTVDELRADVKRLERELAGAKKAQPAAPPAPKVERVEVPVVTKEDRDEIAKVLAELGHCRASFGAPIHHLEKRLGDALKRAQPGAAGTVRSAVSMPVAQASRPRPALRPAHGDGERLPVAQRKVLVVLAQYPGGRTRSQVAILAGYAVTGGGFLNALSALRTAGRIAGTDPYAITQAGLDALGDYEPLPTGAQLLDHWRGQLGKCERACLDIIAEAWPNAVAKSYVAEQAGYEATGGGFLNSLSRLRTLELVSGRDELRASDALFDGGSR